MSLGLVSGGIFESRRVRRKRFEEQEAMYEQTENTHRYFGHLKLADDGGLEVEAGRLYKHGRLVGAAATLVVVYLNVTNVVRDDWRFLHQDKTFLEDRLNITEIIMKFMGLPHHFAAEEMVAYFELVALSLLALLVCAHAVSGFRRHSDAVSGLRRHSGLRRWLCTARLFREVLPELKYFSAMRMLQHVQPYVVQREFKAMLADIKDRREEGEAKSRLWLELVAFIVLHCLLFIFGFDAFIVKFRMASDHANHVCTTSFLKILIFLNQMLGVVQLERYTMQRLHQFIFGGEDNVISAGEERILMVWTAKLFERIWTEPSNGPLRAFAVSVTFSDEDFQRLILNERVIEIPVLDRRCQAQSAQKVEMAEEPGALPRQQVRPEEERPELGGLAERLPGEGRTCRLRQLWEARGRPKAPALPRRSISEPFVTFDSKEKQVLLPMPVTLENYAQSLL